MLWLLAILADASDGDAFDELFRENYRAICQYFARLGYSFEDSQELASETFVRAYRGFSDYRGEAQPLTWLRRIAENVWKNHLRQSQAAKRDGVEIPIPEEGGAESQFEIHPRDRLVDEERQKHLRRAIQELPLRMRLCVWLRVYQDMDFREIAKVLDVSVGTAKSHVSRAKTQLRHHLLGSYPEIDALLSEERTNA